MSGLRKFSFRRYKAFKETQKIDLAPLTLMYGYNNAGKSAALRFLPGLAQSVLSGGDPLYLESDGVFFGATFKEMVWRSGLELEFGLDWGDLSAMWKLRSEPDPKAGVHYVDELTIAQGDRKSGLRFMGEVYEDLDGRELGALSFSGPVPDFLVAGDDWVQHLREALNDLARQIVWISGWRERPERDPRVPSSVPSKINMTVSDAAKLLAWNTLRGNPELLNAVGSYYSELGYTLAVQPPANERTAITLAKPGEAPVNLLDTGEGMVQVLPVLAAVERARLGERTVVCVEQPELHLHPHAQRVLADRLATAAESDAPRLVVETHSHHFMLCIQLAIVTGRLAPERVQIYWVRQVEDGSSRLEPIKLDESGRDQNRNWPPDVFNDDSKLAREIVSERRARGLP